MKRYTCFLFAIMLTLGLTQAQLSDEQLSEIHQLFVDWDQPNHPGGSVGIMMDGQIIYEKGFGLASLEYKVPNTHGTLFNIASVSKQFTSMGIVKLAEAGKLSLKDDIRKHLPELPDFGHTITLEHCMFHTSGMRSLHAMLGLAGWRGDDSRTDEDLFRFMKRQKELNFTPGEEYLYCNTGYMFLAMIIERITGEEFPKWMKENIFLPLGMIHTYVEDDYSRVVDNNATSYYGNKVGEFSRAVEFWGYVGSGNIHSTTADLLRWADNYREPKEGWANAFETLQTVGMLNDGTSTNYAYGIGIGPYKGAKTIGHGGAIGGFRSHLVSFPEQKLNVAVLTNFGSGNPYGKAHSIAEILLDLEETSSTPNGLVEIKAIPMDRKTMESYVGSYWNDEDNFSRKIIVEEDTLRYFRSEGNTTPLIPIAENKFQMAGLSFVATVTFKKDPKKATQMIFQQPADSYTTVFTAFTPPKINSALLATYVGTYYSPELDTHYTLSNSGEGLKGYHTRHGDFEVEVLRENYLESSLGTFGSIKVKRDKKGKVLGIWVSNGRVRNLWFEKL